MARQAIFYSVLGLAFVLGCKRNPEDTKLQYMPDMAITPVAKSESTYLDPPIGSIVYRSMLYASSAIDAESKMLNPLKNSSSAEMSAHVKQGQHLYGIYCKVCHGDDAKGQGTIVDRFPRPPDLTTDTYIQKKDGSHFHTITFGSASKLMGPYGHATTIEERWQLVTYLRTLQGLQP